MKIMQKSNSKKSPITKKVYQKHKEKNPSLKLPLLKRFQQLNKRKNTQELW